MVCIHIEASQCFHGAGQTSRSIRMLRMLDKLAAISPGSWDAIVAVTKSGFETSLIDSSSQNRFSRACHSFFLSCQFFSQLYIIFYIISHILRHYSSFKLTYIHASIPHPVARVYMNAICIGALSDIPPSIIIISHFVRSILGHPVAYCSVVIIYTRFPPPFAVYSLNRHHIYHTSFASRCPSAQHLLFLCAHFSHLLTSQSSQHLLKNPDIQQHVCQTLPMKIQLRPPSCHKL